MTRTEYNRLAANESVLAVLSANATLYKTLKPLVKATVELDATVQAIVAAGQKQQRAAQPGAGDQKAQARLQLVSLAHEIASTLHAAAVTAQMPELARHVDYSISELAKGRDTAVVERCRDVYQTTAENLSLLADAEVDEETLAELEEKIEAFEQLKPAPRNRTVARRTATTSLKKLFRQARTILAGRIDGYVVKFKSTQTDFYNAYRAARRIVDQRGRSAAPPASSVLTAPATSDAKAA
jgi:hypothetical protein